MNKTVLWVFLLFSVFLLGMFSPADTFAESRRITCSEWLEIGVSSECKYYVVKGKEKNQVKDLSLWCFSDPAIVTDQGSSYDPVVNTRAPDYIAAFEWDKCGFGGGVSGDSSKGGVSDSKVGPGSLDCEAMVNDINQGGAPIGQPPQTVSVQGKVVKKEDGSFCQVTLSGVYDDVVKISYFASPLDQFPKAEDKDFKVVNSDDKSYSGMTLKGKYNYAPAPDTFPYWYDPTNYVRAGKVFGNCVVEATTVLETEQQLSSEDHLKDFMTDHLNLPEWSLKSLLEYPGLQNFCGGAGGGAGNGNSVFSWLSTFFSNLFSSIGNIFKPSSSSTLGVTSAVGEAQPQRGLVLLVVVLAVGLCVWFARSKKSESKKVLKRRKRKGK